MTDFTPPLSARLRAMARDPACAAAALDLVDIADRVERLEIDHARALYRLDGIVQIAQEEDAAAQAEARNPDSNVVFVGFGLTRRMAP